jgi:hypothetical protein
LPWGLLGFRGLGEEAFERVEARLPERAVRFQPARRLPQRFGREPDVVHAPLDEAPGEPGRLEHAQVLGNRRQGHVERLGQLAHGGVAAGEPLEHRAPRRVAQGREDDIEGFR